MQRKKKKVIRPQQNGREPRVERAHLIVFEQLLRKRLAVPLLHRLGQIGEEVELPRRGELGVQFPVAFQRPLGADEVEREVADAGAEEVVLDGEAHEVVGDGLLGHVLEPLDGVRVVGVQGGEVAGFEVELVGERGGVVVFVPLGGGFVGGPRVGLVAGFFVQFGEELLLRGGAAEVAFGEVVVDGEGEAAGGVGGRGLAVGFEGVLEGVGHVVGFAELGALDRGGLGVMVRAGGLLSIGEKRGEGMKEERRRKGGRNTFSYAIPASRPACCNL